MVEEDKPLLSSGVYDKLKPLAQIVLPALAAFYLTLAPLWDLPKQEEVAATIAAVAALLGALLAVSTKQYNNSDVKYDGEIVVDTDEYSGLRTGSINLKNYENPADIVDQSEAVFKVRQTTSYNDQEAEDI